MVAQMKYTRRIPHPFRIDCATLALIALIVVLGCASKKPASDGSQSAMDESSPALIAEGQRVFRFDTFGNETFWTDTLRMNEVVEKNVDPTTALSVPPTVTVMVCMPRGAPRRRSDITNMRTCATAL